MAQARAGHGRGISNSGSPAQLEQLVPTVSGVLGALGSPPRLAVFTSTFSVLCSWCLGRCRVCTSRPRADRDRGPLHHRRLWPWLHRSGNLSQRTASCLQADQWVAGQKRGELPTPFPPDMSCPPPPGSLPRPATYAHGTRGTRRCQAYAGMPPSCLRGAAGTKQTEPAERRRGRPATSRRTRRRQAMRSIPQRSNRCVVSWRGQV